MFTRQKFGVLGVSVSLVATVAIIFVLQATVGNFFDFIDISGHPLASNGNVKYINSRLLLRNVAFELNNLADKTSQDALVLKNSLERIIGEDAKQDKLSSDMKESLETGKVAMAEQNKRIELQNEISVQMKDLIEKQTKKMEEQMDLLRKQAAAVDEERKEIADLKLSLVLSKIHQSRVEGPRQYGVLTHGDPSEWKQRTFSHHGTYGFIKYSTYRVSKNKFATPALVALALHDRRNLDGCKWHSNDGSTIINGDLKLLYHMEHHSLKYEIVVAICTLESDTDDNGGYLIGSIDYENVVLINEEKMPNVTVPEKFESQLTFCGPPINKPLDGRAVWEWLEYNRVIVGVDKFIFYDVGGLDGEVTSVLTDYIASGMLDITSTIAPYDVWYYGQGLYIHDCAYRSLFTSKWVMMMDLDEYLEPVQPNTMASLLAEHSNKAYMTHQALWWSLEKCNDANEEGLFAVERMVYHWPHYYCQDKEAYPDPRMCLLDKGHRKVIANPRKVELFGIHEVLIPREDGYDFNADTELRHNHYQGVNGRGRKYKSTVFCGDPHSDDDKVDWWARDYRVANAVAERVRTCPFGNVTCTAKWS